MRRIAKRVLGWFRRSRMEQDLNEEIASHFDLHVDDCMQSGMPRAEAVRQARLKFGSIDAAKEEYRETAGIVLLESAFQDLRLGLRNLFRQPTLSIPAILALGGAIGFSASVFAVMNAAMWKPWAVTDPGSIVKVEVYAKNGSQQQLGISFREYQFIAANTKALAGLTLIAENRVQLSDDALGKGVRVGFVPPGHFAVLGVPLARGAGFATDSDGAGTVILSDALWRSRFGEDSSIIGKAATINGQKFEVVGVANPDFSGTTTTPEEAWLTIASLPLAFPGESFARDLLSTDDPCCGALQGRLARGTSEEQAKAELDLLTARYRSQTTLEPARFELKAPTLLDGSLESGPGLIFALMLAGTWLLVVVACANVANLLLARAAAREKEISMRRSLGASSARIIRQLLTESLLLGACALALGMGLASWLPQQGLNGIAGLLEQLPALNVQPDLRVLGYSSLVALGSCLAFGLAPAFHACTPERGPRRARLRTMLLAAQVSISMVLLIATGLLVQGVRRTQSVDIGFRYEDLSIASVALPADGYDSQRARAFMQELGRRISSLGVAMASTEPLPTVQSVASYRRTNQASEQQAPFVQVSLSFFDVLRIPFRGGRNFTEADNDSVIVNEAFARQWGSENPLGQTIIFNQTPATVVGIVRDANLFGGLSGVQPIIFRRGLGDPGKTQIILPSSPATFAAVRRAIASIDARVQLDARPLSHNVQRWRGLAHLGPGVGALLGLCGLVFAAVGIFGVFSYVIERRTKEIGIRMALGASASIAAKEVLKESARAIVVGLVVGSIASLAAARVLRAYLHGVSPLDPQTYLVVAGLLSVAALGATLIPARRAWRIAPSVALRHE